MLQDSNRLPNQIDERNEHVVLIFITPLYPYVIFLYPLNCVFNSIL